jgi:ABC-2 type transport system permease protein
MEMIDLKVALKQTGALTGRELKHWYRIKIQLVLAFVQPLLWLGLFGQAFRLDALAGGMGGGMPIELAFGGAPNYFSYMAVGMLTVIVLFTCTFSGLSIVWDRRFGFLNKLRVAPIPRGIIPMSRVLAAVTRALLQAMVVLIIAVAFLYVPGLVGLDITNSSFGAMDLLTMLGILLLLALGFAAIFVAIALTITNQDVLMGVVNLLNLPIMFTSAALFPTAIMPDWLRSVANYNPLTFAADGLRQVCFENAVSIHSLGFDVIGLAVFSLIFVAIGIVVAIKVLKY